ncbi:hypothetical protein CLAUR_022380 [Clostridium felsineum]|nr:hypothetical protein CLAUR_022380 [Clostridium felsineum]
MKRRINGIITILAFLFLGLYISKWNIVSEAKLILEILLAAIMCIVIQEISYIVVGRMFKIQSKVICIGPFAFFKYKGKLQIKVKMKVYPGFFGNMQGVHMPDVKSEKEFYKVNRNLKIVLCSGIFSDVIIIIAALALIFTVATNNEEFKRFLIVTTVAAELLAFVAIFSGNVKRVLNMRKASEENLVQEMILLAVFYDGTKEIDRFSYLIERYIDFGKDIKSKNYSDDEMLSKIDYVSYIIYLRLGGVIKEVPSNIRKFTEYTVKKRNLLVGKPKFSRKVLNLIYRYILYLALIDKNRKEAVELYDYFRKFLYNGDGKKKNYTKIFLEHILDIENNYDYLMDINNLIKSKGEMWFGYGVYEMEKNMINLKNS